MRVNITSVQWGKCEFVYGGWGAWDPFYTAYYVEIGATAYQTCHSETIPQNGRGNPHPFTPHQDHTSPKEKRIAASLVPRSSQ